MSLPPYIDRAAIHGRLKVIFPEGSTHRNYCVRELAASAVFVMLYIGAVEGADRWLAPKHVLRMTTKQSGRTADAVREEYGKRVRDAGFRAPGQRWYEDGSREPLRDETLRQGLIGNNAVVERTGLSTTSSLPRYALRFDFARLFDPELTGDALDNAIAAWQATHLSRESLARTMLLRRGAITNAEEVLVTFPNRETRRMSPGPSSVIRRNVAELAWSSFAWFATEPHHIVLFHSGEASSRRLADLI